MSYRPTTRFYAKLPTGSAKLLTVWDLPKGDLRMSARNRFHEHTFEDLEPIVESQISVHVSPDGDGNTVTYTTVLASGRVHRSVAFFDAGDRPLLVPVMSRHYPDISESFFSLKSNSRDRSVRLATFDPELNNLILHYFVSEPGLLDCLPPNPTWCVTKFKMFDLLAVPLFFHFPSIPKGFSAIPLTSRVTLGDQVILDGPQRPQARLAVADLPGYMKQTQDELIRLFRKRFVSQMGAEGTLTAYNLRLLADGTARVHAAPLENCVKLYN